MAGQCIDGKWQLRENLFFDRMRSPPCSLAGLKPPAPQKLAWGWRMLFQDVLAHRLHVQGVRWSPGASG